ncbi:hypothetical protein F7725_012508 [Dissostichus mawsoni]|uniref:Ectonucleoside triphosphate diphosphohydrolase 4 n=1 Tax=Dissostichus mawsoni TaxID=36200 RepID=A0A7J5YMK3_DISMA|nr:hypothetical protein F7725_012508 [Dissostichus mawsoni]
MGRQLLFIGLLLGLIGLLYLLLLSKGHASWLREENHFHRHLARVTDVDATDTSNPDLNYGLVVDCGSSGSRVFVYCWPRHNGNPHELLDIQQMRDQHRKPVVMKIKPGISELAKTPEKASVYAWIGINFVLGRFNHVHNDGEAVVEVNVSEQQEALVRKRTAGVLDMGGVSTQIAYEVPKTEEVAKNLLAEFNLGCDAHRTEHDEIGSSTEKLHLRGTGDFDQCRHILQPFLNRTNETLTSLNGIYQPAINYNNSQFYGFSEFYYCTEDVLRMGGDYNASKYSKAAKSYCSTQWKTLKERFDSGLYATHADLHRLKDIQQEGLKGVHSHWRHSFSFVNNHYLFLACFFIVVLSIMLYLLRLRRIHRRAAQHCTPSSVPWLEEGLGSPTIPITL